MNKYWILAIAAAALFAAGIATGWHERVLRESAMIDAQKTADGNACAENEKTTKEAYDEIIANKDKSGSACAAALSMQSKCIVLHADRPNSVARPQRKSGDTGIESGWLKAYQATCQLIQDDYHTCVAHDKKCVATINSAH